MCRVEGACHVQELSFSKGRCRCDEQRVGVMNSGRDGKVVDYLPRFSISHAFCQQDHVTVL